MSNLRKGMCQNLKAKSVRPEAVDPSVPPFPPIDRSKTDSSEEESKPELAPTLYIKKPVQRSIFKCLPIGVLCESLIIICRTNAFLGFHCICRMARCDAA